MAPVCYERPEPTLWSLRKLRQRNTLASSSGLKSVRSSVWSCMKLPACRMDDSQQMEIATVVCDQLGESARPKSRACTIADAEQSWT